MWTTGSLYSRILICLAALTVPLQGLPAATCTCCPGHGLTVADCCSSQNNSTSCCCTGASLCQCSDSDADSACCDDNQVGEPTACHCGSSCHCGESHSTPIPLTPAPVQKTPTEQLTESSRSASTTTLITQVRTTRPVSCFSGSERAADRCACLCCFTL